MKLRPTDNHSARSITRRVLLLGISLMVVAGLWAPVAHAQPAAPTATEQPLRPTLPAPTGHHRIGVVQLHLVDHSRPDPWVPTQTSSGTHGQPVVPGAAHPRLPTRAVAATRRVGPLRTGQRDPAGCPPGAPHPRRRRCTGRP